MIRSLTFIAIAACISALCLLGTAGAHAKGGSPGFHSFSHYEAAPVITRAMHACGARTARTTLDLPVPGPSSVNWGNGLPVQLQFKHRISMPPRSPALV
jgi:hypothetical protein